jgi:hypothetical protein
VAYSVRADGTVVRSDADGLADATPVVTTGVPWAIDADEADRRVVTVTPDGAQVWDTTTGALLREVPRAPDEPYAEDASVAAGLLALVVAGEVRLVDVADGTLVGALQPAEDAGNVELLPDGSGAVVAYTTTGEADAATSVVDVGEILPTAGGTPVRLRMPLADGDVPTDVVVGSGARQVAVSTQGGVLALFDRASGRLMWSTALPHLRPQALAFTHDGLVVATGDRGVDVVDARRGRVIREIPSNSYLDVATLSGRGGDLVVTLWGGQVVEVPLDDRGLLDHVESTLMRRD